MAWRINGESMAASDLDGDFVVTSPEAPALRMLPCVARRREQVGVNCKLFQPDGKDVLLIPVNESCPVQRIPHGQIAWDWRMLASVRLK